MYNQNQPIIKKPHENYLAAKDHLHDITVRNINELPEDSITEIKWNNYVNSRMFATASWEARVRIYEVVQNMNLAYLEQKLVVDFLHPTMCLEWVPDSSGIIVGLSDGSIKIIMLNDASVFDIGKHDSCVKNIYWVSGQSQCFITLGYDKAIKYWTLQQQMHPFKTTNLQFTPLITARSNNILALATDNYKIMMQDFDSLLKQDQRPIYTSYQNNSSNNNFTVSKAPLGEYSQITSLAINDNGKLIVSGSIDGRCNISDITRDLSTSTRLTFKAHKIEETVGYSAKKEFLYQVNAVGFNNQNRDTCILTGGSNGELTFWDIESKNKHLNLQYPSPFLTFDNTIDGQLMAYAFGYDWHMGMEGLGMFKNSIYVKIISENMVKKKYN